MIHLPKTSPIFALPSVVFFPRTYLPLHIFEPRYREMVKDCLRGDQMITMALLKEGWEKDYYGNPEIYSLGCIGKMIKTQLLEDGRYNLILYGLAKVQIKEGIFDRSYRQGWIDVVAQGLRAQTLSPDLKRKLLTQLHEYGRLIGAEQQMQGFLRVEMDDETLVNLFSSELNFTPTEKMFLLEADTLTQQCKRLVELTQFKIHEVTKGQASG